MATVQDQEKSTPTIRPRSRGNESGHCDDGQPVAFTTAIAETSQSAVIQGQTLACWSITSGMEQILLESSSPSTMRLSTRTWRLQQPGRCDTGNRIRRRSVSWTDLGRDDREAATTAAPIEIDNSPPAQARGHQRCHELHHHVLQQVAGSLLPQSPCRSTSWRASQQRHGL